MSPWRWPGARGTRQPWCGHGDSELPELDLIVVPGGFAYGDYLRSGAMAAHSPVIREVASRAPRRVPVLGICNGFQVLTEAGLLPGVLMANAGLRFICRACTCASRPPTTSSRALRQRPGHPPARSPTTTATTSPTPTPCNACKPRTGGGALLLPRRRPGRSRQPHGSLDKIAGILNEKRNVLGLMPHPERMADAELGGTDGRALFDGLVEALGR